MLLLCCFWLLFCVVPVFLLVLLSVSVHFILERLLGFSGLVVFRFSFGAIFSEVKVWWVGFLCESENCLIQCECNGLRLIAQVLGR